MGGKADTEKKRSLRKAFQCHFHDDERHVRPSVPMYENR